MGVASREAPRGINLIVAPFIGSGKNVQGGVPPESWQGVIVAIAPEDLEVVLNIHRLYQDPCFTAALEEHANEIDGYTDGAGRLVATSNKRSPRRFFRGASPPRCQSLTACKNSKVNTSGPSAGGLNYAPSLAISISAIFSMPVAIGTYPMVPRVWCPRGAAKRPSVDGLSVTRWVAAFARGFYVRTGPTRPQPSLWQAPLLVPGNTRSGDGDVESLLAGGGGPSPEQRRSWERNEPENAGFRGMPRKIAAEADWVVARQDSNLQPYSRTGRPTSITRKL
jgi:hypothetical protein